MESHFAFLDYVKAFDRVKKETNCLKYYKANTFPMYQ